MSGKEREYLDITTVRGKWYVSHAGKRIDGILTAGGRSAQQCIVGGPFNNRQLASEWLTQHPEYQVGAVVWHENDR